MKRTVIIRVVYDLSKTNGHICSTEETKQCIEEEIGDFFTQDEDFDNMYIEVTDFGT